MRRRKFITILVGAAVCWPLDSRAQQPSQLRRIGVLMPFAASNPVYQVRIAAFLQGLEKLGWVDGRNVRIEYRASAGGTEEIRKYAAELVALAPDVIFATGASTVVPLQQATRSVPIVFVLVPDPVGAVWSRAWRDLAAIPPALA